MDIVQQIIDEIKRRIDLYKDDEYVSAHTCGYLDANETLLEYIESLKKKTIDYDKLKTMLDEALEKETKESWEKFLGEEKPMSEDLEEEYKRYLNEISDMHRIWHPYNQIEWGKGIAHHFANWQKERMLKNTVHTTVDYPLIIEDK